MEATVSDELSTIPSDVITMHGGSTASSADPSPSPEQLIESELEAALDKKRWRVHGEDYDKVEDRLQSVCSEVHETISQLVGAMRDLELWQATAAKTCELPTNSLAKITVITSQMVRSRSTLTSQLGNLQDVCRCFFPSTMLLEINGQRELQARAEVEIEKWAQLAFTGQQSAKREFKGLRVALGWYRLSRKLTDKFLQQGYQARVRKLRARVADLEKRVRGLRGQLSWEKKRADRAFGALKITRKLARTLKPEDWDSIQGETKGKSVKGDKGWMSARGVDTRTPRQKGQLSSRSDGGNRPSTSRGAGQNVKGVKGVERKIRESIGRDSAFDAEDPARRSSARESEVVENGAKKGVTNEVFAAAVGSLMARIREATSTRMGGVNGSPGKDGVPLEGVHVTAETDAKEAGNLVSSSSASGEGNPVDTSGASGATGTAMKEPERSPSPVLNPKLNRNPVPSLDLRNQGLSGALRNGIKGQESPPSSSNVTPNNESKSRALPRSLKRQSSTVDRKSGSHAEPSDGRRTLGALPKLTSATATSANAKLTSAEANAASTRRPSEREGGMQRNGVTEPSSSTLPPLTQNPAQTLIEPQNQPESQNPRPGVPGVPRLPLGALSARRFESDGAGITERLAKALGIEFKPSSENKPGNESIPSSENTLSDRSLASTENKPAIEAGQKTARRDAPGIDPHPQISASEEPGKSTEGAKERLGQSVSGAADRGKQPGQDISSPGNKSEAAVPMKDGAVPAVCPAEATGGQVGDVTPALEQPGTATEHGSTNPRPGSGEEAKDTFSKREVLEMRLEQSRQMQILQTLCEERIQGLHDFYEKLLETQLPAVLAQLTGTSPSTGSRPPTESAASLATSGLAAGRLSDRTHRTPDGSVAASRRNTATNQVAASLDATSRAGFSKAVRAVQLTRSLQGSFRKSSLNIGQ